MRRQVEVEERQLQWMNSLNHQLRLVLLLGSSLLPAACARVDQFEDLRQFVAEIKSRPGVEVEPVPEFRPYQGFVYGAASRRSPFEAPVVINADSDAILSRDVVPDFERPRETLESQSLNELVMAGMLVRNGIHEALIKDGFGEVHRVRVGNYLGRNHGRIEHISATRLNLIEIVSGGSGGWVERPRTLSLQ